MTSMATLEDIVARIGVKMEEAAESWAKSERELKESRAESERKLAESRAESERKLAESREENERMLAESRAENARIMAESRAELERSMRELSDMHKESKKEAERRMKNLEAQLGGIGNDMGKVVEMIVIPGVKGKMNELGHNFTMASPGKKYSGADGSVLTEVDLLLENSHETMVVEIKTNVSVKWVNRQLGRLALLRNNESVTGMAGKTMYAAIAGMGFDEEARELAVEKGMYVIEIDEEKERVKVVPPAKVGAW